MKMFKDHRSQLSGAGVEKAWKNPTDQCDEQYLTYTVLKQADSVRSAEINTPNLDLSAEVI